MAKFKVGDKVRLKKGLEVGKWYGGALLLRGMKENAEANGGIHVVKKLWNVEPEVYYLDTLYSYVYTEEMLELVEEEEEKTQKKTKDLKDFLEALALMSQLENIMKRLDELMKSNEEE